MPYSRSSSYPAFLTPLPLLSHRTTSLSRRTLSRLSHLSHPRIASSSPCMLQRPDQDGPPSLDDFLSPQRSRQSPSGAPLSLSTARTTLEKHAGDAFNATIAAFEIASEAVSTPQLVHCTFSVDVDATAVQRALKSVTTAPVLARSINKKDAVGTVELLFLSSSDPNAISVASFSCDSQLNGSVLFAATSAAKRAAELALAELPSPDACSFMLFSHTPGDENAVRKGLDAALPAVIAYGGPAVGTATDEWTLFLGDKLIVDDNSSQHVAVAAVSGSLSFLYSAVIKSWAQPVFTESLHFLIPTYVDDPKMDLLTAIRYNDWDKFVYCIDECGVDVNVKWEKKQHQSPLLAAVGRARVDMIEYLLKRGADVHYVNDGGGSISMYTKMLGGYDQAILSRQVKLLEDAGGELHLTPEERKNFGVA